METLLPVEDAFISGELVLPASQPGIASIFPADTWAYNSINIAAVSVFTLLALLYLHRIMDVFPYLFRGAFSQRWLVSMEQSMRLVRERNSITWVTSGILAILICRLELYNPGFFQPLNPGVKTLLTFAAFVLVFLLRAIVLYAAEPRQLSSRDIIQAANGCFGNFIIVTTCVLVPLNIVLPFVGVPSGKHISLVILAIFFLLFLLRKAQFLSKVCQRFGAISYLCALEVLFPGLMAAAAIFL